LLTNKQKQKLRKNLREYSRAFEEADAAEETTVSAELVAQRKRAVDEWNAWRVRVAEEVAEARRLRGRRGEVSEEEEDKEEIEVWIDELIEQTEEVVE
jgi:translation initiation factor 3 subunit B